MNEEIIFTEIDSIKNNELNNYFLSDLKKDIKLLLDSENDNVHSLFNILEINDDEFVNNDGHLIKYLTTYTKVLIDLCKELKNKDYFLNYNENIVLEKLLNIGTVFNKTKLELELKKKNPIRILKYLLQKQDISINENKFPYFSIANQRFYYDINLKNLKKDKKYDINKNIKSFSISDQISNISAYIIIEKIINLKNEKENAITNETKYENNRFHIAVFGELEHDEYLLAYLKKYMNIELKIDYFRLVNELDYCFFQHENIIYNLQDRVDLTKIFEKYDMVLFLDFSCFYIEQIDTLDKQNNTIPAIDHYSGDINIKEDSISDISDHLLFCFKYLNKLKYSMDNPYAMNYIFDRWLVYNIKELLKQNQLNKNTHVYFYVSQLDDSMDSSYMRDIIYRKEVYNNRNLIILRPNVDDYKYEIRYSTNDKIIITNLWKIVKHYGRELDSLFELYTHKEDFIQDLVKSYLVFDFTDYKSNNEIKYYLELNKSIRENSLVYDFSMRKINEIIDGLKNRKGPEYLKTLNSIFSQCPSLNYILTSYYLYKIDFTNLSIETDVTIINSYKEMIQNISNQRMIFILKSAIYNIIDILENTQYKDYVNVESEINSMFEKYNCFKDKQSFDDMFRYVNNWLDDFKIDCNLKNNINLLGGKNYG
ncbi:MAG: hypothetical protein ACLRT4_01205 [Thomasclavelia sp.]